MPTRRYCAFISYRHADNAQEGRRWAEWLHRALERYVVPLDLVGTPNQRGETIPASLYPIFRDEDELPANADLATGIRAALEVSDHLIVLCSPRSAVSPWVRKEVKEFKELGRSDRLLAVMLAGEPNADDPAKQREGILPEEECFCEELRFGLVKPDGTLDWSARTEPLAADLRPGGMRAEGFVSAEAYREHLTLSSALATEKIRELTEAYHSRLELGVLKVVAGLLGLALSQLTERDAAYRAAMAEKEAQRQREIAERERILAQKAAEAAERERIAAERLLKRNRILTAAAIIILLLAVGAIGFWKRAEQATLQAMSKTAEVKKLLAESDSERADRLFAEDDPASAIWYLCRAISAGSPPAQMTERLWFALNQRSWPLPVTAPIKLSAEVTALTFDSTGGRFAAATRDGNVSIFSSADGSPIGAPLSHPRPVRAIQFSADGTKLLTACDDAVARLWDVQQPAASLIGLSRHDDLVPAIAWNSNNKLYATGSWDKHLRVWDAARPETPVFSVEMKDKIHTVAFDPSNPRRLLAVSKDEVCVWDIGVETPVLRFVALEDLAGASFAPDGTKILSFGEKGDITISEVSGLQQWAQPPPLGDSCEAATFSPNGSLFAVVSGRHVGVYTCARPPINLWDHEFPAAVSRIKFSSEGNRLLAACVDGNVYIFDALVGHPVSEPIFEQGVPVAIDFHPAGNRVVVARSTHTARIWSLSPPAPLPMLAFNEGSPPVLLSQSDDVQCVAQNGGWISFPLPSVVENTPAPPRQFDFGTPLTAAVFDPEGKAVAGAMDGRILVIEDGQPKQIGKLDASISRLTFSSNGSLLAASSEEGALALFHWPTADPIPLPHIHTQTVSGLVLLDPGPKLLSASWDHHLALTNPLVSSPTPTLWTIDGEPLATVADPGHHAALVLLSTGTAWLVSSAPQQALPIFHVGAPPNCAAFSADGNMAAIGTTVGVVTVWDIQTRRKIADFRCSDSAIDALCFSTNGRWLAVGTEDHEARIYQSTSGLPISGLMPHSGPVRQLVFAKNDSALITATYDGILLVWPLTHPDATRAEEISRRVMQDHTGGTRFIPNPTLVSAPDNASIQQLISTLRRQNAAAMQSQIDLLNAYLGSPAPQRLPMTSTHRR